MTAVHRSGFIAIVGRPNTGKSTLLNAMVGSTVAITSSRPQTTRHAVRGVVTRPGAQLVVVDTPGLHRPRTLLGERLNAIVEATLADVDVVVLCLPANERIGPGDRRLALSLAALRSKRVAAVTKTDLVIKSKLPPTLVGVAELGTESGYEWDEIVPLSAAGDDQVDILIDSLAALLPEGPMLYPADQLTDTDLMIRIADTIRAAALEGMRDELPHSLIVTIDEITPRPDRPADSPLTDVYASVLVERDSQKAIVIGHRGERLRDVGSAARPIIVELVGTPVHLALHVAVAKDWQRDPKALARFGF